MYKLLSEVYQRNIYLPRVEDVNFLAAFYLLGPLYPLPVTYDGLDIGCASLCRYRATH